MIPNKTKPQRSSAVQEAGLWDKGIDAIVETGDFHSREAVVEEALQLFFQGNSAKVTPGQVQEVGVASVFATVQGGEKKLLANESASGSAADDCAVGVVQRQNRGVALEK